MASKITWYTKLESDDKYSTTEEIFAGTYTGAKALKVCTKIWNNRWGTTDVDDLKNFTVKIFFENTEDSSLLQYLTVILNDSEELVLNIINNYALVDFMSNIVISGAKNNGIESENKDNFIKLDVKFNIGDNAALKADDIKNLYMEIISK